MWGHTRKKQMFENKERAEKQLLTLLTPAALPPLNFVLITFPLKKKFTSASIPKQELYAPPSHPW